MVVNPQAYAVVCPARLGARGGAVTATVWSLGGWRSLVVVDPQPVWRCAPPACRPLPPAGTLGGWRSLVVVNPQSGRRRADR